MNLKRTNSLDPHFQKLVEMLEEDLYARYGELQRMYQAHNKLSTINQAVVVLDEENPIGCGGFRPFQEHTVEIKRMFVVPEYRGKGAAKLILEELENWAQTLNYSKAILETGIAQPEAIRFYKKMGYTIIPNYAQYEGNSNSICMEKILK